VKSDYYVVKWVSKASRRAASRLNYDSGGGDAMVVYWRGVGRGGSVRRVMSGEGRAYTSVWLYETCISMTLINMVSHNCVVLRMESVLSHSVCDKFSSFMVPCTVIDIKLLSVNRWEKLGRVECVHDRVGSLV